VDGAPIDQATAMTEGRKLTTNENGSGIANGAAKLVGDRHAALIMANLRGQGAIAATTGEESQDEYEAETLTALVEADPMLEPRHTAATIARSMTSLGMIDGSWPEHRVAATVERILVLSPDEVEGRLNAPRRD